MLGVELVTDRKDKTPAKAETAVLFEKLKGASSHLSLHDSVLFSPYPYSFASYSLLIRSWDTSWKRWPAWQRLQNKTTNVLFKGRRRFE